MFAPNADQMHVINHCVGKPTEEKRNILQESARIARGNVTDLAKLDVSGFDAAIIPGEAARAVNKYCCFFNIICIYIFFTIIYTLCVLIQGALVWQRT